MQRQPDDASACRGPGDSGDPPEEDKVFQSFDPSASDRLFRVRHTAPERDSSQRASGQRDNHASVGEAVARLLQERQMSDQARAGGPWYNRLVIRDDNPLRTVWNVWLFLLLMYTGTVFPFKMAFIDFGVPARSFPNWYKVIEIGLLDLGFYIDLVVNFFFTYRDDRGREVFDMAKIAKRYIRSFFFVNLIACIPPSAFSWAICFALNQNPCSSTASVNQVGRLSRLQRVSRMARLARLTRLGRLASFLTDSPTLQKIRSMRGVRITNSFFGLIFVVHLVACGWWICASLHQDHQDTWLYRRPLRPDGTSMLELSEDDDYGPVSQWLTSMYWTLTVFTTVGFGDISAFTRAEMIYACFTMIVGCIVNGIILSEVITLLTSVNEEVRLIEEQQRLIRGFGKHMQVKQALTEELTKWVSATKIDHSNYDREEMRSIVTSGILPRRLLNVLPQALFGGRLVANQFIQEPRARGTFGAIPPRFPVLLALSCQHFSYDREQAVYNAQDHAWNIYLVLSGVFSYTAQPHSRNLHGLCHNFSMSQTRVLLDQSGVVCHSEQADWFPYQLFCEGNYFGDIEIIHETCPRYSTARCESKEGSVLVLHKRDVFQLVEEFPNVTSRWRTRAKTRARQRRSLLQRQHPLGREYRDLAASMLQRNLTYLMARKKGTQKPDSDYKHVVLSAGLKRSRRSRREPSEIVPQYVRDFEASMADLQDDMASMKEVLIAEVNEIKEALRDAGYQVNRRIKI